MCMDPSIREEGPLIRPPLLLLRVRLLGLHLAILHAASEQLRSIWLFGEIYISPAKPIFNSEQRHSICSTIRISDISTRLTPARPSDKSPICSIRVLERWPRSISKPDNVPCNLH